MADSNDRLKVDEPISSRWPNAPAEGGPVGIQQAQTNSTLPVVSTAQVAPISVSPSVYAANTPLENGKEVSRADIDLAKRHLMVTSCTVRDREKDTYAWRSIWGTSRADMGEFGVGIQLYFDFLLYLGMVLLVMAFMATPLLHKSAQGDLAGVGANLMLKTSIGNIGECGRFGELCADVTYVPYRKLNPGSEVLLRDRTPLYGGLDASAIGLLLIFAVVFNIIHIKRVVKQQRKNNTTPSDYAIHVMGLPRQLGNSPEEHHRYADRLKEHFERLVGDMPAEELAGRDPNQPVVCEVALARDYQGAVRNFLGQGKLYVRKYELEAQMSALQSRGKIKKARKLEKQISTVNGQLEKLEKNVKSQKDKLDVDRDVCQAHVIFNEESYKKFVLHRYRFSGSFLWRLCQSQALRFEGRALTVKQAYEPSNIYCENLDFDPKKATRRRAFTCCISFFLLIISCILLVIAKIAGIPREAAVVGNKDIWIIGNYSRPEGDGCFEICDVQMFADDACQDNLFGSIGVERIFDSTGEIKVMNPMTHEAVDGVGFNMLTNTVNNLSVCSSANWIPRTCVEPDERSATARRSLSLGSQRRPALPHSLRRRVQETIREETQEPSTASATSAPYSSNTAPPPTSADVASTTSAPTHSGVIFRVTGRIDGLVVKDAIQRGLGSYVHIESTLTETPQTTHAGSWEEDPTICDEKSLANSITSLKRGTATKFAMNPLADIKFVACGTTEAIECGLRRLSVAVELIGASRVLYGGIEKIVVESGVVDGCPSIGVIESNSEEPPPETIEPAMTPTVAPFPTTGQNQIMNLAFVLRGAMDQLAIRDVLIRVFGPYVQMKTTHIVGQAPDGMTNEGEHDSVLTVTDLSNFECGREDLWTSLKSLGFPSASYEMAEVRVDACGPDVIMQCVAEQLDVASGSVSGEGGIEKLTMEMALSDGCDTSTVVTEQPSGVIKHVQFEMGGYLDQAAVKEALALGLGPSVWMRAVAVEGAAVQVAFEEPFLVVEGSSSDGTSSSPCSTDSLSRAMKEMRIGSESEFKSKNSWIVVRVYACTAMEEVECLMNRVRQARDLVTASGSTLYGGVATMTLSDDVNDGCPSDLSEVTYAPVIDVSTEAPHTVDSISSVTMAIEGVWEEQFVRNLLEKAFGEDVVLGDISAISGSGSTYSATEITLSDDAFCDRTVLVELLQQLPKVNVDSAESRRAEVTVCGETKKIKCIRQMLVQARQFTKSLSGSYYGGLTSIEPLSSVTDGCPILEGNLTAQPEEPQESGEGSGDTTSVVPQQDGGRVVLIKGYYLDDEMTAVFKTALSNVRMGVEMDSSTITAGRSSFPTENDSDGELPRRVAEVDCDVTALAVALKSLTLVSEGTISTQRPYKETRIIICGSAAQLECAANKVGQAQTLMRDQGTQLYGGLTELGLDGDSLPVCPLDEVVDYQPSAALTSRSVEFVIEGYFQVQGIAKNLRDAMGESVQDVFLVEIQRSESPTTEPGEMVTTGTPPMVTTQAVPLEETSVTTPPPNRRSLQDTSSKFVCGTNNLADAIRGLARQNETTITQAKVKLTLRACARPARIDCIVDQIGTASAVVDSAGEQLYGGIQSIQTDGVIAKRCDTTDRIDTTGATTVSISATNCLATQTACESDPDRRCYDSSQRCDRQWLCPNGDDEMGCSYQCLNNEVRCPATGLCIPKDLRKDGCQECADEAYVNDDTCVFLKEAKDALLNLPVCEINVVENIFFERYGANCTFEIDPCCVTEAISADEDASSALECDGSTYRPDLISSGQSLLSWVTDYCDNFQRMQNAQACTINEVEVLRYSSLRCETFLLTGSLPCECFDDLGGILQEDRSVLEACDTFRENMVLTGVSNREERESIRRYLGTVEHRTAWESVRARCDAEGGLQRLAAAESLISESDKNPVKKMITRLVLDGDLSSVKNDPETFAEFQQVFKTALLQLLGIVHPVVVNGIIVTQSTAASAPEITVEEVATTTPLPRRLQTEGTVSSSINFEVTVESGITTGTLVERETATEAEAAVVVDSLESVNTDPAKQTTLMNTLTTSLPNLPPVEYLSLTDPQVRDAIQQLCLAPRFKCPITGTCIDERFVCNQIAECEVIEPGESVAADERECIFTTAPPSALCKDTQFKCGSGECIEDVFYCDEVRDCADGSDETQPECVAQLQARAEMESSTAAQEALAPVTLVKDWLGVMFAAPVMVKCIKFMQPVDKAVSEVKMFACDESEVFRDGAGVVLRKPETSCKAMKVITLSNIDATADLLKHKVTTETTTTTTTPAPVGTKTLAYSTSPTSKECISGNCDVVMMKNNYECYDATGEIVGSEDIGSGVCKIPRVGEASTKKVEDDDRCEVSLPISLARVKKIKAANPNDDDLLDDDTYQCFCYQQLQFNIANGNTRYFFPPYDGEAQKLCEPYLLKKLFEFIMAIVAVLSVTLLNWLLTMIIYFLVDMEKHTSFTTKEMSLMKKLFVAQWINTGLIILFVNAQLHGVTEDIPVFGTTLRIGDGEFDDFTSTWYKAVGIGLAITIAVQIAWDAIPPLVSGTVKLIMMPFVGRKKKTQDAMNQVFKLPDFNLASRLAQTMNVLFCAIMYSSSMPILLFIGALYCLVAYWADKTCLLRLSARPPAFTQDTVIGAIKLLPLAALLHCLLAFWMLGNQNVFPSDFFTDATEQRYIDRYMSGSNAKRYEQIMYSGVPMGDLDSFQWYIEARIEDGFRRAAVGQAILIGIIVAYYAAYFCYYVFGSHLITCMRTCWLCLLGKDGRRMSVVTNETYTDAVEEMVHSGVIHSYEMRSNHRYKLAYTAISELEQRQLQERSGAQDQHQQGSAVTQMSPCCSMMEA